jgi:hypothetical protein
MAHEYFRGQFKAAEITEPIGWPGRDTRTMVHAVNQHDAPLCDVNTFRSGVAVRDLPGEPNGQVTCGKCRAALSHYL